ncbi:4-hydroxythreonine-4-phosphate dehydrogenase PdxA [Planktotalea sp.]|uniref:4-hydroxythreonine-4-phosphate dehydrogenase PdxA n=1 Tax=Planktotalea sp. TaxID=2029877 RepID=UPI0025F34503|nr:4-hydroxythreonine-4-phosphate dehydrogenase PdxA [Planktotalea sp.]
MNAPIALSCGEPAGIGPEIAVKAWNALRADVPFFWIGDPRHLPKGSIFKEISDPSQAILVSATSMPVLSQQFAAENNLGAPNAQNAQGVIDAIETGVALVKAGKAGALCTAPIHKKALQDGAGFTHPGHTEFLASLDGGCDVVMMLASEQLRVVPATIHIPLKDVPSALTPEVLESVIRITHAALGRQFNIASPRIAVSGLNPHAGEGGKMGLEDDALIAPVLEELRAEGFVLNGPLPADTMFHAAARARYDAAICMYHDQALIPIKTLDFDKGVNITLGLSFIRTSPDHGTAFDIAGQDIANPSSLIEALRMAKKMSTT